MSRSLTHPQCIFFNIKVVFEWCNASYYTYEWVVSHIWMSHVTHMNESCHTYEWVMSHIWMSRVTHEMSHVSHESWVIPLKKKWVMSPKKWVTSHTRYESSHVLQKKKWVKPCHTTQSMPRVARCCMCVAVRCRMAWLFHMCDITPSYMCDMTPL